MLRISFVLNYTLEPPVLGLAFWSIRGFKKFKKSLFFFLWVFDYSFYYCFLKRFDRIVILMLLLESYGDLDYLEPKVTG